MSDNLSQTNGVFDRWAPRASLSETLYTRASHTLPGSVPTYERLAAINDPLDYEQKYAPDEEFQELCPKARVFRVYNDECAKHDVEMVNGWREGLDVLLVFAALFSAVVTTFIVSTSQALQVDNGKVGTALISEMIGVQRAILHVLVSGPKTVEAVPSAVTSFHPSAADFWVNGLWFTSLGLSLATTLLAVLAKQWIHQFMSFTSGSPRNRSRVRHFRYRALQKWHVPIIIELLPVLMHAALGLFFIGLVVYLSSLSHAIAAVMGIIAASTFGVYSVSNLLPIFYPDCAYKTPLSTHFFAMLTSVRRRVSHFIDPDRVESSFISPSLRDVELNMVDQDGHAIDASSLGWLFNATSNLSVQSIILQSLGSLPFQSLPLICKAGPEGIASVLKAIQDHFAVDQPLEKFERFQRTALLFETREPEVVLPPTCKTPSKYSQYLEPTSAIEMIKKNLCSTTPDLLDLVLWGKIFSTAILPGTWWLEIDHDEPSRLWSELLRCVVRYHNCDRSSCDVTRHPLLTFPLQEAESNGLRSTAPFEPQDSLSSLCIDRCDPSETRHPCMLRYALVAHMYPSLGKWLLHMGFPNAVRSPDNYTADLPDDIFLCLLMLQTPSIQKTSSVYRSWVAHDPELLKLIDSGIRPSLFHHILQTVQEYPMKTGVPRQHKDVDKATLVALQNVIMSDAFGSSTIITLEDEAIIVESVFQGLNWRLHRSGSQDDDFNWLTPEIARKVIRVAVETPYHSARLLSNVLSYLLCSSTHSGSVALIYSRPLQQGWLQGLATTTFASLLGENHPTKFGRSGYIHPDAPPLHMWDGRYTGFLAVLYIDGLATLSSHPPWQTVYHSVLNDLREPGNFRTMCKILLLGDVRAQAKLWKLAKIVQPQPDDWNACLDELHELSRSDQARKMFSKICYSPGAGIGGTPFITVTPSVLPAIVDTLAKDIARGCYIPPTHIADELGDPLAEFAEWYLNNGRVDHDIY